MNKLKFLWILLLTGLYLMVNAQNNPGYFSSVGIPLTGSTLVPSGTLSISPVDKTDNLSLQREKNMSAKLYLKLDLGDDYVKVAGSFGIKVSVEIKSNNITIPNIPPTILVIDEKTPEVLKVLNLLPAIASLSNDITITVLSVSDKDGVPLNLPPGLLKNYIDNNLRLSATFAREYAVDVRTEQAGIANMTGAPSAVSVAVVNRKVTFNWQPDGAMAYPDYELQILKLENKNSEKQNDDNEIATAVDWDKALRVETQAFTTSIALTMAEGTGFYIWRVRPIGNYFEGGIANSENYGEWSYSGINDMNVVFNKSIPTPYAFYFTDPDENTNWIYNRVFTEGDNNGSANPTGTKVSEGMNYADGLLRSRQSQAFNSSNGTTIASQTISDYSGRPALTTLPVPVIGGLTGYKLDFVKNTSGDLYTAAFYDLDNNIKAPAAIKDNLTDFAYYSNNPGSTVNNDNVPDAEGYAFKRTLFKADGTGRISEESGVGKVHSLGTITNASERTTRILFGTPSDDELIRIFGDEAPLSESVIKTITIDPNNVVSVSYTSKEGKTIATALISNNTDNLVPLEKDATPIPVTNTANQNISSDGKFISSKRIIVPADNFSINLSYSLDNSPSPCGGGCNFKLNFYLVDLKNNITYLSDADNTTSGIESFDVPSGNLTFPDNWVFKAINSTDQINHTLGVNNKIELNEGEYLFIKEVYAANNKEYADNTMNAFNDQYQPILDAIAEILRTAKSKTGYNGLNTFFQTFNQDITAYNTSPTQANSDAVLARLNLSRLNGDLPLGYMFPVNFTIPYTQNNTSGAVNDEIVISVGNTGCSTCDPISVPVPKPEICYACDGTSDAGGNSIEFMRLANNATLVGVELPYGINDFRAAGLSALLTDAAKRDAIDAIVQRYFINFLEDKMLEENLSASLLNVIAPGFTKAGIKFMLSNMLISKYSTAQGLTPDYNYTSENLFRCWTNAVNLLNSVEAGGGTNVVQGFNDQDGNNSSQNNADDKDNWDDLSKRQQKKLQKKLGQEMEEFSTSSEGQVPTSKIESLTSIINTFMDCAGYQFAAIIDGGALPSYVASANTILPDDYLEDAPSHPTDGVVRTIGGITYSSVPVLAGVSVTCGAYSESSLTYPYILKPEWMYKYFVYNVHSQTGTNTYINDQDLLIPHQVQMDLKWCYNTINSYITLSGTTCNNTCDPGFLHNDWSAADRLNFYMQIKDAPKCWINKGVSATDTYYNGGPPTCGLKSELVDDANKELNAQDAACEDKAAEIKSALIAELESSCYTIVDCHTGNSTTGEISGKEIDFMVQQVIDKCKFQVSSIRSKLPLAGSNPETCSGGTSAQGYGCAMTDFPKCIETAGCYEIIFTNDNLLVPVTSNKIEVALFPDCDRDLLNMLSQGNFLPYIAPLAGCPARIKEWEQAVCNPTTGCNGEKVNCTGVNYSTYSTELHLDATGQ